MTPFSAMPAPLNVYPVKCEAYLTGVAKTSKILIHKDFPYSYCRAEFDRL